MRVAPRSAFPKEAQNHTISPVRIDGTRPGQSLAASTPSSSDHLRLVLLHNPTQALTTPALHANLLCPHSPPLAMYFAQRHAHPIRQASCILCPLPARRTRSSRTGAHPLASRLAANPRKPHLSIRNSQSKLRHRLLSTVSHHLPAHTILISSISHQQPSLHAPAIPLPFAPTSRSAPHPPPIPILTKAKTSPPQSHPIPSPHNRRSSLGRSQSIRRNSIEQPRPDPARPPPNSQQPTRESCAPRRESGGRGPRSAA